MVAGAGALLATSLGVPATGSADPGDTLLPNGQFDVTATAAAKALPVPPRRMVTFYTGIKRNESGARSELQDVSDPDSVAYREFWSRKDIRQDFGANHKAKTKVRQSAEAAGLTFEMDKTGVFAAVTGRAGRMTRWLDAPLRMQKASIGGLAAVLIQTNATHPAGLKKYVKGFVGLDIKAKPAASTASAQATPEPPYTGVNEGTPEGCLAQASPELNTYAYSYNQLRTAYGIDQLPAGQSVGKATRVAILAQGDGYSDDALADSAECFDLPNMTFKRVAAPGLTGQLPEGGEGDLDVQVVQSVLPAGSTVHVIESPNFDLRFFPTWATAFSLDRKPAVITTSYGICEQLTKQMPPGARGLTEAVLVRLGLSGTSAFSAAGDRGSSDCINNETGEGPKELAVDYPGSSRYVTSVGGTRLTVSADNKRTQEVVWNSQSGLPPIGPESVGGGGGVSQVYQRPWWQPRSMTKSDMRTVPDIAAHAASGPGWVLFSGEGADTTAQLVGGTSAATPFTAAAVGIIAAAQRLEGEPSFGLIQPALYDMYAKHPEAVHDVSVGSNDLFDKGCCSAKVGYDKASGLGAPKFDEWYLRLPIIGG